MRKISKQIFKGHIADMSFFRFLSKLNFTFLIFWYSIKYLGNIIGKFYYWPNRKNRFYRGIIDCS